MASKILALTARQLPRNWQQLHGYQPALLETVITALATSAANWTQIGQTLEHGKKSAVHHQIIPIKDIWMCPLRKDFRSVLCREQALHTGLPNIYELGW